MENFSDKQNEVFKALFGELSKKPVTFITEANTLIEFDDDNFTRLYLDLNNCIVGTDEALERVEARAKYLEIKRGS